MATSDITPEQQLPPRINPLVSEGFVSDTIQGVRDTLCCLMSALANEDLMSEYGRECEGRTAKPRIGAMRILEGCVDALGYCEQLLEVKRHG